MTSAKLLHDNNMDSWYYQSREHAHSDTSLVDIRENTERNTDTLTLKSLMTDCGATSVVELRWVFFFSKVQNLCRSFTFNSRILKLLSKITYYREELLRLRAEIAKLQGAVKEQKSTECKEKESIDISENSSDGQAELRKSLETLQAEPNHNFMDIRLLKEKAEKSDEVSDGKTHLTSVSTADEMESPKPQHQTQSKRAEQLVTRHRVGFILM